MKYQEKVTFSNSINTYFSVMVQLMFISAFFDKTDWEIERYEIETFFSEFYLRMWNPV